MSSEEKSNVHTNQISSDLKNYFTNYKSQFNDLDDQPRDITCLLCDISYVLPTNKNDFLTHLFEVHRLVIGDVEKISSLKSYVRYWRMRFKEQPLTTYCTTLTMGSNKKKTDEDTKSCKEYYFLLSDCLAEDKTLRDELQRAKLEWILAEQIKERTDTTFQRGCIFCRMEFSGSCIEYIKHLCQKHNILLGKPENLIFINEFLDKIQNNIESFICIYCEKKFKNRLVLKEHMRKKLHKQINPNNKSYDKYYITNYLIDRFKRGKKKPQHTVETEDPTGFSSDNEDEDWSDWNNESISIMCLFCKYNNENFATILQHMRSEHKFDFEEICGELTFYQKVKVVNYIRKQIHTNRCIYCDINTENLIAHMDKENHCKLPTKRVWDQPEFYFPMFESDSFLYNFDTNSDSEEIAT